MIKLYGCGSPNVHKILFFFGETGLPYELHRVDLMAGETCTPEFLTLNPNGKVPVIVDSDGPGGQSVTVFESGAILQYLAEKTGRFWPADLVERSQVIQWLTFQTAGVGPMVGQAIHFLHHAQGDAHAYSRERYFAEVRRLCSVIDRRLAQTRFLASDTLSLANMALYPWMRRLPEAFGAPLEKHLGIARWTEEVDARTGWHAVSALCEDLMRQDARYARGVPRSAGSLFWAYDRTRSVGYADRFHLGRQLGRRSRDPFLD